MMESSFTDAEKRFILAEMIKVHRLDIGMLVELLKSNGIGNGIEPEWLAMQLPHGRNVNQCMDAAEHMFQVPMKTPSMKRKSIGGPIEQAPKRLAMGVPSDAGIPSATASPLTAAPPPISTPLSAAPTLSTGPNSQHINIQPRPTPNATMNGYPLAPMLPQPAPAARRRGRPSRADRSRQLRPILPQHLTPLAPRTPTGTTGVPLAPAQTPTQETKSPLTPTTSYSASPGTTEPQKGSKRRGRPPSGDKAQPRVVVEGALEHFESTPPIMRSEPPKVESPTTPHPVGLPTALPTGLPNSPRSQKERAIPSISHLTQEGVAQ